MFFKSIYCQAIQIFNSVFLPLGLRALNPLADRFGQSQGGVVLNAMLRRIWSLTGAFTHGNTVLIGVHGSLLFKGADTCVVFASELNRGSRTHKTKETWMFSPVG